MKSTPPVISAAPTRQAMTWRHLSLIATLVVVLFTTDITTAPAYAAVSRTSTTTTYIGMPNTAPTTSTPPKTPPPPQPTGPTGTPPRNASDVIQHPFSAPIAPFIVDLSGGAALQAASADQQLTVAVPASAVTTTDVAAAPGGKLQLAVTQIAPAGGSTTGGHFTLGTYLLQVQDGTGKERANGAGLRQPVTLTWHTPGGRSAIPYDAIFTTLNGSVPTTLSVKTLGKNQRLTATYTASAHTITTMVPLGASSNAVSFDSTSPVAFFGKPQTFQNDLHTGDLTTGVPIDLPAGPGGLTPPITLSYSSGAISSTHNVQAAAPWVGDGWSLDPGAITWSETDAPYRNGTTAWASTWSISDPYGTSGNLIPPTTNISTYYDDTLNPPAGMTLWQPDPTNHAKIYSHPYAVVDTAHFPAWNGTTGYKVQPPCFDVWLTNGVHEEFGCSFDSRQWYVSGTTNYVTKFLLSSIIDPSGNQVHFYYDQDMAVHTNQYPRDVVLNRIEYDAPGCTAQAICTGSAWTPQMEVVFQHSNAVATPFPGAPSCGPQASGLRCDDPIAKAAPDQGTPQNVATQVLNEIDVKVRPSGGGGWNLLRKYRLAYGQAALTPNVINDPTTGNEISVAGELTLDQVQEFGADGTTAYPPATFSYVVPASQYYLDVAHHPAADAGCGPAYNSGATWNGVPSTCFLWSRSYNSFYMQTADNGEGLHQTFLWENTHNDTHGTYQNQNLLGPLQCGTQTPTIQAQYPCDQMDDMAWSHLALASRTLSENAPTSGNANATTTATWGYTYELTSLSARSLCGDCWVGMYWGNQDDNDYLDYYNGNFQGFWWADITKPDGSAENHLFWSTTGWGVWDHTKVPACSTCADAPNWAEANAASGQTAEVDYYGVYDAVHSVYPLLKKVTNTYTLTCPPGWVGASSPGNWANNNVAELDPDNPVAVCNVWLTNATTYQVEGITNYSANTVPMRSVSYSYNNYGLPTQTVTTGNDLTTTPTRTENTNYVTNDNVNTSSNPPTGYYLVDRIAADEVFDPNGNKVQCTYHDYDGQAFASGQQATMTQGLETTTEHYTNCVAFSYATWVAQARTYNAHGDIMTLTDADANHGMAAGHTAQVGPCKGYTTCMSYDANYGTLPTTTTNVFNQTSTTAYATTAANGFGLWPNSTTDANNQTTSMTYDPLGRTVSTTAPGETSGDTTTSTSYTVSCPSTGASLPCLEADTTQRLDATTTVTKRDFYDGLGHHVESRSPAPGGQDVVQYALYDPMGHLSFQSQPYFVTAYTGPAGSGAYSIPNTSKLGTTTTYDGLDRVLTSTNATSAITTTSYSVTCAPAGTNGDQACYSSTTSIDANGHKSLSYADALGRDIYNQSYSGNSSGTYTLYRTTTVHYDVLGDKVNTTYTDGTHHATATYDALGQVTAYSDPNLGSYTLNYDPNGNPISSVDPRGANGTIYIGYDGLDRPLWKSNNSNGSSPYATYTYDSTTSGNQGAGQLTGETFASGPSQSVIGSYSYTYDARSQKTGWKMTLGSTSYPLTIGYNDAGQATSLTYPDGDVVMTSYGIQGWLAGVTEAKSGTTNTLLNTLSYMGTNGASQLPTNAAVDNGIYQWNLSYDTDLRLQETKVQQVSNSTVLFDQTRAFDAVGNVTTTDTALPVGTDNQAFCYDEQNRLVWAGSKGTPSCGANLTPGTLNSGNAQYAQTYSYDVLDRLTQGPLGAGYQYTDPNHISAVTSAPGYTASYNAAGSMTGRNGQVLGYDALRQLMSWQNQATNPTQTASYAYNGSGQRVQQVMTVSGITTTTSYIGSYEEVSVTGGTTTTTKYYSTGLANVVNINGTLSYLVTDGLESVNEALTATGGVQATQLFSPYGTTRYSSEAMPTSYGFTGQHNDPSGLMYYQARYYDPSAGQFITADDVDTAGCYAYVHGNPETDNDPTGHCSKWANFANNVIAIALWFVSSVTPGLPMSVPSSTNQIPQQQIPSPAPDDTNNQPVVNGTPTSGEGCPPEDPQEPPTGGYDIIATSTSEFGESVSTFQSKPTNQPRQRWQHTMYTNPNGGAAKTAIVSTLAFNGSALNLLINHMARLNRQQQKVDSLEDDGYENAADSAMFQSYAASNLANYNYQQKIAQQEARIQSDIQSNRQHLFQPSFGIQIPDWVPWWVEVGAAAA